MSDHENPPEDLFDAVCRLDDIVEWLRESWPMEAEQIARATNALRKYIVISLPETEA
jgi:hypothetical protein